MTTEVANTPSHGIYHYIWGGAFICLLIVINHVGMTMLIEAQQRHIALSKLSSQQRILFQETGRMAHDIMTELGQDEPNQYLLENLQKDLKSSVDELYKTYKSIIALADENVVPFMPQTDVHSYYFEEPYALDRRMNSFFARINIFATQDPASLKRRFHRWTSVDIAIAKNGLLVKGFDELMQHLYTASSNNARILITTLQVLNGLVILTIMAEVFFIFKPLIEKRNRYHEELVQSQQKFKQLAHSDSLTGLANREHLNKSLAQIMEKCRQAGSAFFVALIDLDGFKAINDQHGHDSGDAVLKAIAARLQDFGRDKDVVARLGGDEFTLIITDVRNKAQIPPIVDRLLLSVNQPIHYNGRRFFIGVSIGGAFYPDDADNVEDLLKHADSAMYISKSKGKNCFTMYSGSGEQEIRLEKKIDQALQNNEYEIYYQPKIEIESGRHIGFEALIRWNHQGRRLIYPSDFIPYLEKSGQIIPITQYIFHRIHDQYRNWIELGFEPGRIAINIPEALISGDIDRHEFWHNAFKTEEIDLWLDIEITENVFVNHNHDLIVNNLSAIRDNGIHVYLDDFGTGYASLSHLRSMPIDGYKVDKSFIANLLTDQKSFLIVRAITELGHSLGKQVIAEGVEYADQLNALRSLGCRFAQGFLFSKPMSAEATKNYLALAADIRHVPRAAVRKSK